jgi:hypothetical protein
MRAEKQLMRHMNNMNANRNEGHVHIPVSPSYSYSQGANRNEGYIRIPLFLSEPYLCCFCFFQGFVVPTPTLPSLGSPFPFWTVLWRLLQGSGAS